MAERRDTFWTSQEIKLWSFENVWYKIHVHPPPILPTLASDHSSGGDLETALEKIIGNCFVLTGPAIDTDLKENGECIKQKWSRSNLTELAHPIVLHIPTSIVCHLTSICATYDAGIKPVIGNKSKTDKLITVIEKERTVKKIGHPKRFDCTFF